MGGLVKNGAKPQGANRAFQILVPETAFLIWKLRCERRIERNDDPERAFNLDEVTGKWKAVMNERLQQDRILTNKERFGPKALEVNTVLETWTGMVHRPEGESLPDNWIKTPGVLVGIGSYRRGRNR
ncbi:hypothetical protein ARMSODRAFT_893490 [Armillaria solidipes]|uniref:Uncharacterized protein n=1 Tax=Armillaria solidipes TaxID=1076256 RepID=A0A2H3AZJ1_9AGAR|nr:hypothetical protein ARMSODRAFT_893490 [Armillaria solidipes]